MHARLRSAAFFPDGFAEAAVPCANLMTDLKKFLLEGKQTKSGIDEQVKKLRLILSGYRAMTTALKKGSQDMNSALNTIKAATTLQQRAPAGAPKKRARTAKLPAFATTNDPNIIKIHRNITRVNEIDRAVSWDALKSSRGGDKPFVLRRRRGFAMPVHWFSLNKACWSIPVSQY